MAISKLLLLQLLRDPEIFPVEDAIHFLGSNEEGNKLLTDTKLAPGQAMPALYHTDITEITSDDALTYIFFYGVGAPLVRSCQSDKEKELDVFIVDLDIANLEVCEGFRKYGANAYFDADQNVTSIERH
jgi:hypothetical protein